MGTDAMPPRGSGLPARLVLGPALRAQSDRRLVRLVREGYESAFEEIVRRYRRPLDRFAASIVGGRSEDVTQDSFRKALVALRRDEGEVELRPWLYRIVRNTALNDLRDRPPAAAELAEELIAGGRSAATEAEQRAEIAALTARLRALPERQRAALVMRELEGMGHEEIAATLGISRGAARQAIARGRAAVRAGLGILVPPPVLRALAGGADGAGDAAVRGAGEAIAGGGAGVAAGGAAASVLGGGAALKAGLATVVVAGSIGAGVAIDRQGGNGGDHPPHPRSVVSAPADSRSGRIASVPPGPGARAGAGRPGDDRGQEERQDATRRGDQHRGAVDGKKHLLEPAVTAVPTVVADHPQRHEQSSGGGPGPSTHEDVDHSSSTARDGGGRGADGSSGDERSGGSGSGRDGSGQGDPGGSRSGGGGSSGGGSSGSDGGGSGGSSGGGGSGGSSSGSSDGGHGSDDAVAAVVEPPPVDAPVETLSAESSSSGGPGPSSSSSSSSGDHGSDSSGGSGSDDELPTSP